MDIKNLKLNIEQKVVGRKRVVIVPHNRIDFDAIGSALGLAVIVQKMNAVPLIVVNDDVSKMQRGIQIIINDVKKNFRILTKEEYLKEKESDDLYILTDVNKRGMVSIGDVIDDPKSTIIIDHHDTNETTIPSEAVFVDNKVSSASEVIARLMSIFRVKCPNQVANYLLAGIYLDTNHMSKNVSNDTYLAAAKLTSFGANVNRVNDLFLEDFDSDRRVQDLVNGAEIVTFTIATILAKEGVQYKTEDIAKAADYLLKYGVDASFAVARCDDGLVHVSARSPENIDVSQTMNILGGGGSPSSAAATVYEDSIEEVGKKIRKEMLPTGYIRH